MIASGKHRAPPSCLWGFGFRISDFGFRISGFSFGLLACCLTLAGCAEQQMARQPAHRPLSVSPFFSNDMSARPLVAGTVPRGTLKYDAAGYDGLNPKFNKWGQAVGAVGVAAESPLAGLAAAWSTSVGPDAQFVDTFPFPITEEVVKKGKQRFETYCYICHGYTGAGDGMVVQRGFTKPPSYHEPRLKAAPVGHFYNVITKGYGAMPAHNYLVEPEDRWAIAAYIRALQLSQGAPESLVPADVKKKLADKGGKSQ
jgi:mono/diheme cytochrome c family protein